MNGTSPKCRLPLARAFIGNALFCDWRVAGDGEAFQFTDNPHGADGLIARQGNRPLSVGIAKGNVNMAPPSERAVRHRDVADGWIGIGPTSMTHTQDRPSFGPNIVKNDVGAGIAGHNRTNRRFHRILNPNVNHGIVLGVDFRMDQSCPGADLPVAGD